MNAFLLSLGGLVGGALLSAVPATALSSTSTVVAAPHGGQYRGPGSVNPPGSGSGSGGSSAAGPSAPSAPPGGSAGGSGGSGAGPGGGAPAPVPMAGAAGASGPAGVPIGEDLTRWSYWWEFQKDSYLRLKSAVHDPGPAVASDEFLMGAGPRIGFDSLRPTRAQRYGEILPALHRMLQRTSQRDIVSSCLVALAKLGIEDKEHPLLPTLQRYLRERDQEIRETAALAMGISQSPAAVPDLVALLRDAARGRELCDRPAVDDRTRAFAGYALGLIAHASADAAVKRDVFAALAATLEDESIVAMAVPVAVVNALGLLAPEGAGDAGAGAALRRDALAVLRRFHDAELGAGRQLVQAHAAPAAAALLAGEDDDAVVEAWRRRIALDLESAGRGDRVRSALLSQSAAFALGGVAEPNEPGSPHAWVSAALMKAYEDSRDRQASSFALMALARIGGAGNRDFLLRVLRRGGKALERPWAALGLGVLERRRQGASVAGGAAPDPAVEEALLAAFDGVRNPETIAAYAVAAGLARITNAAPRLRELLGEHRAEDELAGYLCIGLGLLGDLRATEQVREIAMTSARRPQLVLQASMALGRLGDKRAAEALIGQMRDSGHNVAVMASLAYAVGQIGDRRSVGSLIELVEDDRLPDLARAFGVVALGGVADKELEPWNAKIGRIVNYRASVETLTNLASGVLDIL